jgi:type IV pilus assembly protein PilV
MMRKFVMKNSIMEKKAMLQKVSTLPQAKFQQGAVLLEAMIGIVIFSFGILALAGLQGAMVKNTTDSSYRSEASYIAQQQLGRMWGDPNNLGNYLGTSTVASLPNGSMLVTQPVADRVLVTVTWQTPGEPQHNYQANAYVLRGCPTCT